MKFNKTHKTIFVLLLIIFLLSNKYYALTSVNIPYFNKPNGYVRIDFINNSDEEISQIIFKDKQVTLKNIPSNKRKTVLLKHKTDSTYAFTVYYKSGKKLVSRGAFIDGGYFIKEYILNNTTKIEQTNL